MYEKILIPLDGSELAEVALPYAEDLAAKLDSELILIHLSESKDDPYMHMYKVYMDKMLEITKERIKQHAHLTKDNSIKVSFAMCIGNPAEEILNYAENKDVGLIIMATHGKSGIKRWTLGSVADKVMTATKKPIMLVRATGASEDIRSKGVLHNVLLPLDGSAESEKVVPYIEDLASKLKLEVILFQAISLVYPTYTADAFAYVSYSEQQMESIKDSTISYLQKVGLQLQAKGISTKTDVRIGSAADEIINYADEIKADLVAMTTHGRSGIGRWLFGSNAIRVIRAGNTPLMLVRS